MKIAKKILPVLLVLFICVATSVTAFAVSETPRLVDNADLLSDSEETELLAKLNEISEKQRFDVVIVTVDSLEGKTPQDYADDYYDYNGYGFGANNDGVLLLISMEDRDWYISTTGYGITAVTDAGREYMADKFAPELSDGNYAQAFGVYADLCDEFVTQAKTGEPFDVNNLPKEPFPLLRNLAIAIVIGIVVAIIITGTMKNELKTVKRRSAASNYVKANSLQVYENRDMFLYSHVDRQARPKNTNSGGGGSVTHTSSSGTTHGGGGGKF